MEQQRDIDFIRIKDAIEYLDANYQSQPSLDDVANHINLSPFHFQRLFSDWVGVSPKGFLKHITIERAKTMLNAGRLSLFDAADQLGLSGTGRLHDLFVNIESMTPGEYKNGGANLTIHYSYSITPFGEILIASTNKGICKVSFTIAGSDDLAALRIEYPNSTIIQQQAESHKTVTSFFSSDWTNLKSIKLHLRGTEFQLKIWKSLLKIPFGELGSYGDIALSIGNPKSSRAVGTAIAKNPIAYIIPCHRVIQSTGSIGGYRWDSMRKKVIVGWESAQST